MTKSIAIIGCGYVGGDAATALRYSGYRVTGTSRSTQGLIGIRDIVDEAFLLDISDEYFPSSFLEHQDALLVSAAPTRNGEGYESLFGKGISNLANALRNRRSSTPLQLIYISSAGIYGDCGGEMVDESTEVDCSHQVNKLLVDSEKMLLNLGRQDVISCILRLGGIYGPGRDMVSLIKQAAGSQIPKNGDDMQSWTSIVDITRAIKFALENKLRGIYNIVDDTQLTRRQLSNKVCEAEGLPPVLWANTNLPGMRVSNALVSNQKIKDAGFEFASPKMFVEVAATHF